MSIDQGNEGEPVWSDLTEDPLSHKLMMIERCSSSGVRVPC